jgi:hypothetical protein
VTVAHVYALIATHRFFGQCERSCLQGGEKRVFEAAAVGAAAQKVIRYIFSILQIGNRAAVAIKRLGIRKKLGRVEGEGRISDGSSCDRLCFTSLANKLKKSSFCQIPNEARLLLASYLQPVVVHLNNLHFISRALVPHNIASLERDGGRERELGGKNGRLLNAMSCCVIGRPVQRSSNLLQALLMEAQYIM